MNWYDYPALGVGGWVLCSLFRYAHNVWLARMAFRHGKPLVVSPLGGYQLGAEAIAGKKCSECGKTPDSAAEILPNEVPSQGPAEMLDASDVAGV